MKALFQDSHKTMPSKGILFPTRMYRQMDLSLADCYPELEYMASMHPRLTWKTTT